MSHLYRKTTYNPETQQQLWMSIFADSHDSFCSCETPFAHALDCMFPEGHTDRNLSINQIITRDQARWHSGGTEGESHGLETTEQERQEDIEVGQDALEDLDDVEIEELIAAADAATER